MSHPLRRLRFSRNPKGARHKPPLRQARKPIDADEAALHHYPYVKRLARRLTKRLPTYMALDDVVSVGFVSLMDSISRYDPHRSDSFHTYAEYRIKGAILDELRSVDHLTREQRSCVKAMLVARHRLVGKMGRLPESDEMAQELGCDLERFHVMRARVAESRPLRRRAVEKVARRDLLCNQRGSFLSEEAQVELRTSLRDAIEDLPPRLRLIVTLHYYEGMTLLEIGDEFEVTESRVCQLHAQAMEILRDALSKD